VNGEIGRPTTRAAIHQLIDAPLSASDARAYRNKPISEAERDEVLSLVRWFRRRYPTGADRLAYVRHAFRRWRRYSSNP